MSLELFNGYPILSLVINALLSSVHFWGGFISKLSILFQWAIIYPCTNATRLYKGILYTFCVYIWIYAFIHLYAIYIYIKTFYNLHNVMSARAVPPLFSLQECLGYYWPFAFLIQILDSLVKISKLIGIFSGNLLSL